MTTNRAKPHERLKAWHACNELAKAVFRVSAEWPMDQQEVLGDEVRTSARKATEALEIGAMLGDPSEFFERTIETCGKLGRLWSTLILARDENLIGKKDYGELETLRDHATRLTWGLRTHLRRKVEKRRTSEESKKSRKGSGSKVSKSGKTLLEVVGYEATGPNDAQSCADRTQDDPGHDTHQRAEPPADRSADCGTKKPEKFGQGLCSTVK